VGGGDWSRAWNVGRTAASVLRPLPSANVRRHFFQTLSFKMCRYFFLSKPTDNVSCISVTAS